MSPPPAHALTLEFDAARLRDVRQVVASAGAEQGLDPHRIADLVLATDEVASNSVLHGGGVGTLRVWPEGDAVVVEIVDSGHITDPLIGAVAPGQGAVDGRGLWIVHQVCDRVQLRSRPGHTVCRLRMRTGG
jgi:anti-sigma regulatory factor (Ser/Thr protein kinase)